MLKNIIFMGGIHGVGKSTICRNICNELKFEYLSASELIKWKEINEDSHNKNVSNIPVTQDRLIIGLNDCIKRDKFYILDGHYCLLNRANEIVNISLDTFKLISPISLNIILGDIVEIRKRLENRDSRPYNEKLLERLQEGELDYAKALSKTLGVTLNVGTLYDFSLMLDSLRVLVDSQK